jgi:hypothetical protein
VLQFLESLSLALFFASQGHGDVDQTHVGLAQQAHGHATRNALIIGMRRKE